MLLHFARISVITIAVSVVGIVGFLLARPNPPTVITVVVPNSPAVVAAPAGPTTVVQPVVPPYGYYCGWGTRVACHHPYYWH